MKKVLFSLAITAVATVAMAEEWDVSVRTFDMDSEPKYEVIIRDGEGKTRTVGERTGFDYPKDMLETFGNVWETDVNFDGHTDVLICLGRMPASDQTFVQYDAWVYDTEDGKFYCRSTRRPARRSQCRRRRDGDQCRQKEHRRP